MTNYTAVETSKSNTWSVLRRADSFGYGYVAQDSQFDNEATCEGWEVMFVGMPAELAIKFRDIYSRAGIPQVELTSTPDLSNLLTYDMTQPIEDRQVDDASEYDLVSVEWQGRVIEGVITWFDETAIELDGFVVMPVEHFLQNATLIAKADSDCGFITEYTAYLLEQDEKWSHLYDLAIEAQNRMAA